MACKIGNAIADTGYSFLTHSDTNQIFPILPKQLIDKLSENYAFIVWQNVNSTHSATRFVTSWATPLDAIDSFINQLRELSERKYI